MIKFLFVAIFWLFTFSNGLAVTNNHIDYTVNSRSIRLAPVAESGIPSDSRHSPLSFEVITSNPVFKIFLIIFGVILVCFGGIISNSIRRDGGDSMEVDGLNIVFAMLILITFLYGI